MNKVMLYMVLALSSGAVYSQTLSKNDPLKFDADYYLMEKDFDKALTNYLNILKSEPDNSDIKYKAGICYLNSEDDKKKAIPYLEEAVQHISEKYNPNSFKETNAPADALFLLGSAYRVNNQINEAIEAYNKYKNYLDPQDDYNINVVNQYLKSCELALNMQQKPIRVVTANLGGPVNNDAPNFNAVFSGDGKTVVYTSRVRQGYDIFMSTLSDSGTWSTPRNITSVLGTGKYMVTSDISDDGQTLLLILDDPMNAEIFMSRFNKGRWSKAESIGKEINTKYNETHASLSTDGKILYFTSDRKGGQGDLDLYKAEQDEKGSWSDAVNLGAVINSPFNEETPFIAETGDKLYFSSEGHNSMGGYDIFYYDYSNPAGGVVNVGYPLNTTDNDLFFVPSGDGTTAYYAFAGDDSHGGRDIYRVVIEQMPEEEVATAEPESEVILQEDMAAVVPEADSSALAAIAAEEENRKIAEATAAAEEEEKMLAAAAAEENKRLEEAAAAEEENRRIAEAAAVAEEENRRREAPAAEENIAQVTAEGESIMLNREAASFRIQIMALRRPVDFRHFTNISGIMVVYKDDNWYRYTLGGTSDITEAETLLSDLRLKGYPDAFIKASGIIPQYTIQVMAVPGPLVNLERFSNLPEIYVTRGDDHFCRYSTGEFSTREEALASLDSVRSKGYRNAFVTRLK